MSSELSLIDLLEAQGVDLDSRFARASADRLRHLCAAELGAVYLPYGWIDIFPAGDPGASPRVQIRTDQCAGLADHPSNPKQLVMVSVSVIGEESVGAMQWVSVAHLAHRDCPLCSHVWVHRAEEYEVAAQAARTYAHAGDERWSLFVRTSTDDDQAVVLTHVGDLPARR